MRMFLIFDDRNFKKNNTPDRNIFKNIFIYVMRSAFLLTIMSV